jgi:hypothetical protein
MKHLYVTAVALPLAALLAGCASPAGKPAAMMATAEYASRPPLSTSLFPSDQAVLGDEAIERILSSKLELPAQAKVAVMKFPERDGWATRYYGHYYWTAEDYLRLQQDHVETVTAALLQSGQVQQVTPLPTLMTPQQTSIPVLREAAVRMQADLLLVFRVTSDTYSRSRAFAKDKVKAYSNCELVLLDVRTGLVPFTRVIMKEKVEEKLPADFDLSETMRRAESAAALEALRTAAEDLVKFIGSLPRKGE